MHRNLDFDIFLRHHQLSSSCKFTSRNCSPISEKGKKKFAGNIVRPKVDCCGQKETFSSMTMTKQTFLKVIRNMFFDPSLKWLSKFRCSKSRDFNVGGKPKNGSSVVSSHKHHRGKEDKAKYWINKKCLVPANGEGRHEVREDMKAMPIKKQISATLSVPQASSVGFTSTTFLHPSPVSSRFVCH